MFARTRTRVCSWAPSSSGHKRSSGQLVSEVSPDCVSRATSPLSANATSNHHPPNSTTAIRHGEYSIRVITIRGVLQYYWGGYVLVD